MSLNSKIDMHYIRGEMVDALARGGISSSAVLDVLSRVPRHLFVSEALRYQAYRDISLPIGFGQTISKPSVIAKMVQAIALTGDERVLEIGTGSGYQSAVLAELAGSVVTLERIGELAARARALLVSLDYTGITCLHDGDFGKLNGEFDRIIVAAGADILPAELFGKLVNGGILVIPVAGGDGHIIKKFIKKNEQSILEENIGTATFVPLIRAV